MKRLLLLLAVPACFGEGPEPTMPTDATVLFHVSVPLDQFCSNSRFIGDVALGTGKGYALTVPYLPSYGNCGNNGGQAPQAVIPVSYFGTTTTTVGAIGNAGQSDPNSPNHPRLAAAGDLVGWSYIDRTMQTGGEVVVGTSSMTTKIPMTAGFFMPIAMTADPTTFYVGGVMSNGTTGKNSDVDDPTYPCCGPFSYPGDINGHIYAITGGTVTTLPTAPKFNYNTLKSALVSNSTSLFFTEFAQPIGTTSPTLINSARKDGTMPATLGMIPKTEGTPVGLGASDTFVAWSSSVLYENLPYPPGFCNVSAYDLTTGTATKLLTKDFSCMDAAVDDSHVYFAIVDVPDDNQQNMFGLGIGRVSIADKTFESIRLGITGPTRGVRRVYVDGAEDIVVVDPFVVANIKKSAFAGKHDF